MRFESGLAAWLWQKTANAVAHLADPIMDLSDVFDERAFRAAKRFEAKDDR